MNPKDDRDDVTLVDLTHLVAEHLPEGWEFTLRLREGQISLSLTDPQGQPVQREHDDRMSFNDMVLDLLNYARKSDGLLGVDLQGRSGWDDGLLPADYDAANLIRHAADKYEKDGAPGELGFVWGWRTIAEELRKVANRIEAIL
jgi:hypothetical protein